MVFDVMTVKVRNPLLYLIIILSLKDLETLRNQKKHLEGLPIIIIITLAKKIFVVQGQFLNAELKYSKYNPLNVITLVQTKRDNIN